MRLKFRSCGILIESIHIVTELANKLILITSPYPEPIGLSDPRSSIGKGAQEFWSQNDQSSPNCRPKRLSALMTKQNIASPFSNKPPKPTLRRKLAKKKSIAWKMNGEQN